MENIIYINHLRSYFHHSKNINHSFWNISYFNRCYCRIITQKFCVRFNFEVSDALKYHAQKAQVKVLQSSYNDEIIAADLHWKHRAGEWTLKGFFPVKHADL